MAVNIFKRSDLIEEMNQKIQTMTIDEKIHINENCDGSKVEKLYPLIMNTEIVYSGTFTDTFEKIRPVENQEDEVVIKKVKEILYGN